jgi:superfamily II DNA or RNA helicase
MSMRHRYQVGDRLLHAQFGSGLVVEVRERGFYDILEVAFQSGVRRLTSIHPDIVEHGETIAEHAAGNRQARPPRKDGGRAKSGPDLRVIPGGRADGGGKAEGVGPVLESIPGIAGRNGQRNVSPSPFANPILELDPGYRTLLARHRKGHLDPPRAVRLRLKAEELRCRRAPGGLSAFDTSRGVIRYPHQEEAARRVIEEMRGRALLADEVGLGKTIEAGLILSEYVLRGMVSKALILVPAALQRQWRDELKVKFGIHCRIRRRGERFRGRPFIITTLDTARLARNRAEILRQNYDLVIVDEAHRLKNHRTLSYDFANSLVSRRLLLLTATPVQNDLREIYNLVTLLKPGVLDTFGAFRRRFIARGDRREPRDAPHLARLLTQVMVRTRREDTAIRFPRRTAETALLEPTEEEMRLYADVTAFVRAAVRSSAWKGATGGWHLVLQVLQKEIGSSPQAAVRTLEKIAARSPETEGREAARELAERARSVGASSKLRHFLDLARGVDDKILVFTQFKATQRYLADALAAAGIAAETFYGGMTDRERETAVARFRDEVRILISTDAGGEGRNLQFCRRVVNFDLPWNPMKVEQRIGRVHRLGQERDVFVHNYSAKHTVEAHVLSILQQKLNMFELVVGELDMVLGNYPQAPGLEESIFKLWTGTEDEREIERGFRRLGDDLEIARVRYEHVKDLDRQIFEALREAMR